MSRRRFLQTSGGMAVMLSTLNACSSAGNLSSPTTAAPTSATSGPTSTSRSTTTQQATTTSEPGGTFNVPDEPEDLAECESILGDQGEFIFDVHTHHVMPDGAWRQNAPRIESMINNLVPSACAASDRLECLDRISYVHDMFLASDTTVALLSDVPNSGDDDAPVPFDAKLGTQEFAASLTAGGEPRVLVQDVIAPNFGDLGARLELMEATHSSGRVASFKVYTAWGPGQQGFALDDPAIGVPVVEQARALGVNIIAAHKGLPLLEFDRRFNGPRDIVAMASRYPDMRFIVYHSAFERDVYEGAHDPGADTGIDSLIAAMDEFGVEPNANLFAELGTTWRETMRDPTQAAHAIGKLVTRVGDRNLLWGTDGIWLGSPQAQIQAFRSFEITPQYQEQFGYPELTDQLKRQVFGLNAAALFGLDPDATRCAVAEEELSAARVEAKSIAFEGDQLPFAARGPATRREVLRWIAQADQPLTPF
ncbi:MAG: amidohydrolase family protein [Acidimicrobiales bacterium]